MPDWKNKNKELIQEASRHAEAKLAAQVQFAVSADARASILSGVYAAAASGTLIVLVTSTSLQNSQPAMVAAIVTALFFFIGAVLCVWAIWPCDFHLPGNEPSSWYEDILGSKSFEEAAGEQLEHFDKDIHDNNETLKRNARRFQAAVVVGGLAPIAGVFAAGALCLCR